ncbi:hypothetical protein A2572_03280 [Candidatus Collierbacteria bacterium RIFOXYD1_FULL_40_9]|uniref:Uncharacterized protein n=1 Tax=Candidatus Collierbacteria bacterium RIFOXYD1_FULL_40_9 TaxID=1817731 RepID=A0A1F5FWZ4_9BACT|nr:MAG: hypothetical protein A2572_03280 [Candidatus Collierbacteria bacterium RIFOXYD1_FULL_40_9]
MTKQNALLGRVGPVKIGVGFKENKRSPDLYPHDRLTSFLNLNTSDRESTHAFCDKYLIVPRDLTQGWLNALKTEQEKIRPVADKVASGQIDQKSIDQINVELDSISTKLVYITDNQIISINEQINGYEPGEGEYGQEGLERTDKNLHFIKVDNHGNSLTSLWQDLANVLIAKTKLKNCMECGLFFIPNRRVPNQKFDSELCADRYKKRKAYRKSDK